MQYNSTYTHMYEFLYTECSVVLSVLDPRPGDEADLEHQVGVEEPLLQGGAGTPPAGRADHQGEEGDQQGS